MGQALVVDHLLQELALGAVAADDDAHVGVAGAEVGQHEREDVDALACTCMRVACRVACVRAREHGGTGAEEHGNIGGWNQGACFRARVSRWRLRLPMPLPSISNEHVVTREQHVAATRGMTALTVDEAAERDDGDGVVRRPRPRRQSLGAGRELSGVHGCGTTGAV